MPTQRFERIPLLGTAADAAEAAAAAATAATAAGLALDTELDWEGDSQWMWAVEASADAASLSLKNFRPSYY